MSAVVPADVTPPAEGKLPAGYATAPEGIWYGGTFGDEPLEPEFDPTGAGPIKSTGESE